jgi:transcriptional regulator with XRE-family HTH domain
MTSAAQAREAAGFTLEQAAKKARICTSYLRAIEKGRGTCSYPLAMRLSRLYRCSANVFLYTKKGSETPTKPI